MSCSDLAQHGISVYQYEQLVMGGMVNCEGCTPLGGGHPLCQIRKIAGLRHESFIAIGSVYFGVIYPATRCSQTMQIAQKCRKNMSGFTDLPAAP